MIDNIAQEPVSERIRAENVSDQFNISSSEGIYCQDSFCDETSGSSNFLDLKTLRVSDSSLLLKA